MPAVHLPALHQPYVVVEATVETSILELDKTLLIDLYKAHGALLLRGFGVDVDALRCVREAVLRDIGGQ